ncbi:hypothetical protein [Streptomyces sp. NPDC088725]|uniref:hypothetical protein n=1 Tax=Streptomyces sp. NPDC088725 TaxID=3365873 RepID=UPI00381845F1
MATPAAAPARHRARRPGHHVSPFAPALSIFLGICYGAYTSFLARGGGAATYGQLALALISGLGLAVLVFVLTRFQRVLPRELRAAAYGVLIGGAVGFLHALTGASIYRSCGIGLGVGIGAVLISFYWFYMREQ